MKQKAPKIPTTNQAREESNKNKLNFHHLHVNPGNRKTPISNYNADK